LGGGGANRNRNTKWENDGRQNFRGRSKVLRGKKKCYDGKQEVTNQAPCNTQNTRNGNHSLGVGGWGATCAWGGGGGERKDFQGRTGVQPEMIKKRMSKVRKYNRFGPPAPRACWGCRVTGKGDSHSVQVTKWPTSRLMK